MPRQARYVLRGAPHHIMHRGVNKEICFKDDQDRMHYAGLLEETSAPFGCEIHAFVLMGNHVHVLATPEEEEALGLMMKRIAQIYSQRFNRKYGRCGPVWQGRFKSSPVESEAYLMRCYRYVELNPVRAGLVKSPGEYPWSSFGANGQGLPSWIVPHDLFRRLGCSPDERARRYREFVAQGMSAEELAAIRAATRSGLPLGSEAFLKRFRNGGPRQA